MINILEEINIRRFGGKLIITMFDKVGLQYKIDYPDIGGFDLWPSKRKLEGKWPDHPWMVYVFIVFKHEIAKATNGTLSDESDDEVCKPAPEKYSSYEKWIELHDYKSEELKKFELSYAPKGMENY